MSKTEKSEKGEKPGKPDEPKVIDAQVVSTSASPAPMPISLSAPTSTDTGPLVVFRGVESVPDFIKRLQDAIAKRDAFVSEVTKRFQEGQHFWTIKDKRGGPRKSLSKGGALEVAKWLGLHPVFHWDAETAMLSGDWGRNCVFIRCDLMVGDEVIESGIGIRSFAQNNKDVEKTWKMARKSALEDAVILAGGLAFLVTAAKPGEDPEDGEQVSPAADDLPPGLEVVSLDDIEATPVQSAVQMSAAPMPTGHRPTIDDARRQADAGAFDAKPHTDAQRKKLMAIIREKGLVEETQRHEWTESVLARAVDWNHYQADITAIEMSNLIETAIKLPDAKVETLSDSV